MTSDLDNTSRRRPPTIDLMAKEVETENSASTGEPSATDPPGGGDEERDAAIGGSPWNFADVIARLRARATGAHAKGAAAGAVIGAVAMLSVFAALWIAGLVPLHGIAPLPSAGASAAVSARLDKIETTIAAQRPDTVLAARTAAAEADAKSLRDSLAAVNHRLDDIAVTAHSTLAHADAASSTAEASKSVARQPDIQRSDLDALTSRISALERTTKTLAEDIARRPASTDDRAARLSVAAEALRAAAERGAPYEAELAAVKSFGANPNAIASLEPFAANGIPGASLLAHELAMLTPALLRASGATPTEGSFFARLQVNAEKLVRISPIDAPQGDDPAAVVGRINVVVARGDFAAARADIARLPDAARSLAETWAKKTEAREAAITASQRIAADALAALGKPARQ